MVSHIVSLSVATWLLTTAAVAEQNATPPAFERPAVAHQDSSRYFSEMWELCLAGMEGFDAAEAKAADLDWSSRPGIGFDGLNDAMTFHTKGTFVDGEGFDINLMLVRSLFPDYIEMMCLPDTRFGTFPWTSVLSENAAFQSAASDAGAAWAGITLGNDYPNNGSAVFSRVENDGTVVRVFVRSHPKAGDTFMMTRGRLSTPDAATRIMRSHSVPN